MIYLLKVLFPYIVLFYILDCFIFVKKNHIAFCSNFGKKFSLKQQGIRFIGFSPICQFYCTTQFPFFANDKGILVWNKDSFNGLDLYEEKYFDFLSFDEIEKIECAGEYIKINNIKKIHLTSSYLAKNISEKMAILKEYPMHLRSKKYEDIFEYPKELKLLHDKNCNLFYVIQFLVSVLFIFIFVLLPCFIYLSIPVKIEVLIFEILFLYTLTAGLSIYTHRMLSKSNKGSFILFFHLLFSPVSSIHVIQMITKNITFNMDWMALSAHMLSPGNFKKILVKELKRLHFSKRKCKNTVLESFLLLKEKQYKKYLQHLGINKEVIFEPPLRKDSTAHSYCPFCETEFQKSVYECSECAIKLSAFDHRKKLNGKVAEQGTAH